MLWIEGEVVVVTFCSGLCPVVVATTTGVTFCSGLAPVVVGYHHSRKPLQESLWWCTGSVVALYPYNSQFSA